MLIIKTLDNCEWISWEGFQYSICTYNYFKLITTDMNPMNIWLSEEANYLISLNISHILKNWWFLWMLAKQTHSYKHFVDCGLQVWLLHQKTLTNILNLCFKIDDPSLKNSLPNMTKDQLWGRIVIPQIYTRFCTCIAIKFVN